ncbi:response regulator [Cyanobacteria bacterium FACHB-63]|nr:response regulator [Cyanobacteria bacterium FACHB-63]
MSTELTGIKVLLVENEMDIAGMLCFVLEDAGAEIVQVLSGLEALSQLTRFSPTVILCNIRLPDMTGEKLLQSIRLQQSDAKKQIPVIGVADSHRDFSRAAATKAGFDGFLSHPISSRQLFAEIRSLVTS